MRGLVRLLLAGVLGCLGGCESLFFYPSKQIAHTPAELGLVYQDVRFYSADNTALTGWFLPASTQPAKATIVHVHGNAAKIGDHVWAVRWLPAAGFNVLTFDYRGFGQSEGRPGLDGAVLDVQAALAYALARPDVDPDRLVVFGQSLGGALSLYQVAHSPLRARIRALVVDSTFAGYRQIASEKLAESWLTWPVQWLPEWVLSDRLAPRGAVSTIAPVPLLLVHGTADTVVPARHSEQLYALAGSPRQLWLLPGVPHTAAFELAVNRRRLLDWLDQALALPVSTPPAASAPPVTLR